DRERRRLDLPRFGEEARVLAARAERDERLEPRVVRGDARRDAAAERVADDAHAPEVDGAVERALRVGVRLLESAHRVLEVLLPDARLHVLVAARAGLLLGAVLDALLEE